MSSGYPESARSSESEVIAVREPEPPRTRDSLNAIRNLVEPCDLRVVFQPIVELESRSVFAHEALVRCTIPSLEYPPVLFQRSVEAGCAGRLGRMIREITMPLASGRRLFLNIHPQEIQESWLVRPDDPLFSHDHDVFLEITESVPLTHFELCLTVLREVRDRGRIHLVVDDLGAGYSNLRSIADLEPSVVKLDRDLVVGVDQSARQRQLVKSVVLLCHDLDASVVAEGIETTSELHALLDCGVQYAQGFLFARPSYPFPSINWPPTLPSDSNLTAPRAPLGPAGMR